MSVAAQPEQDAWVYAERMVSAAERLAESGVIPTSYDDQHGSACLFCSADPFAQGHTATCPWQALLDAFEGKE
jgi:hypothetical protein